MGKTDISKARLFNQQLINSKFNTPVEITNWMGAIQAQEFSTFEWAIGIRMKSADGKAVREAYNNGDIIRTHLNRTTWQVITGEDLPWMVMLHGKKNIRAFRNHAFSTGVSLSDKMIDDSRDLLVKNLKGGNYMAREDLISLYETIGINDDRASRHLLSIAESEGVICSGPVIGRGVSFALAEERIKNPISLSHENALQTITRRYFQSHSPATFEDFLWWSGLTIKECRSGMEIIGNELHSEVIGGKTYFMHESNQYGRMPKELVHLLPPFDEILIGYKDRTAFVSKEYEHKAFNKTGIFYPIILHNRKVIGNWLRRDLSLEFFEKGTPTKQCTDKALKRLKKFTNNG